MPLTSVATALSVQKTLLRMKKEKAKTPHDHKTKKKIRLQTFRLEMQSQHVFLNKINETDHLNCNWVWLIQLKCLNRTPSELFASEAFECQQVFFFFFQFFEYQQVMFYKNQPLLVGSVFSCSATNNKLTVELEKKNYLFLVDSNG